jgi:oligopeptide/dipeptide ABC transporter ATP-binding protein
MTDAPLLEVQDLQTFFHAEGTVARAVDGVSFTVGAGETLAIVGESGSGKSVTSLSIMRLVPIPPGEIAGGRVLFRGRDLLALPEPEMRHIRGNEIGMIFQEPMSSLNPLLTVGEQIAEVVRLHQGLGRTAARQRAIEMLGRVNIPDPERRAREYPHRLSGGMRQRVMIAMALACRPALLIADEPTTALDVTIQAQILHLIRALQIEMSMSVLFITHNLGVVAQVADRVAVMYAGRIVERAPTRAVFKATRMPYTEALLAAIPRVDAAPHTPLAAISGRPPDLTRLPAGCAFAPRCRHASERCARERPPLRGMPGHAFACWHPIAVPQGELA